MAAGWGSLECALEFMSFPDYAVDLSPKRARKNTRAHVLSR
jgi:hypothetical protein